MSVVRTIDSPVLVVAGAGTGKTKVLIYRVAYLVELGENPRSILLLTFTRKAASEMLKRAASLLKSTSAEQVSGGTFHSFANMTLRHYAKALGYGEQFTILDDSDAADVVNLLRTRLGPEKKAKRFPKKETLVDMFSKSENTLTKIEEVVFIEYSQFTDHINDIMTLKRQYDEYKRKYNLMDYDDLLKNLRRLLEQNESIRKAIAGKFSYIMVVGIMLPWVVRFNAENSETARLYEALRGGGIDRLISRLEWLLNLAGLPRSLGECRVDSAAIPSLAAEASKQWTATFNPRPLTEADFVGLYQAAFQTRSDGAP